MLLFPTERAEQNTDTRRKRGHTLLIVVVLIIKEFFEHQRMQLGSMVGMASCTQRQLPLGTLVG